MPRLINELRGFLTPIPMINSSKPVYLTNLAKAQPKTEKNLKKNQFSLKLDNFNANVYICKTSYGKLNAHQRNSSVKSVKSLNGTPKNKGCNVFTKEKMRFIAVIH